MGRIKPSSDKPIVGVCGLVLTAATRQYYFTQGPDKIVDLARGVGKAAGELKAVPQVRAYVYMECMGCVSI